jgi:hypothetical protein
MGAHVFLPDELGALVWFNANEARTSAARGTVSFDITREGPDLVHCLSTGEDLFVSDGLAADAPRRALRMRYGAVSLNRPG